MSSTTAPQPGTTGTQAPPSPNGSAAPQPAPAAPVVPPLPSEAHPAEQPGRAQRVLRWSPPPGAGGDPCRHARLPDRRSVTALAAETGTASGPGMSCRSEFGLVIAVLSGELEISCAPVLREQLLGVLRPAASRLVIDLSGVSYADASGLAVLVGTGRRAGLLGGFLRLAAPVPAVADVLRITGLSRHLDIYPTVAAAISSPLRQSSQAGASWTGASSRGAGMSGASWRGAGTTGPGNRPAVATRSEERRVGK